VGRSACCSAAGTKDPQYSDIKYVEALIAPCTVYTLPLATLEAYRDHGEPQVRIEQAVAQAPAVMQRLADLGIDMRVIEKELEQEGIAKFIKPYESVLATLRRCGLSA